MPRPYFNQRSKDGTLPNLDTLIKRKDVNAAIEQFSQIRRDAIKGYIPGQQDPTNQFLRLSPELRNKIYTFALDLGPSPASRTRIPCSSNGRRTDSRSTGTLHLCKQINTEAISLMQAYDVAYIPVMASMDFAGLVADVLQYGPLSLPPTQSTIFAALTTFMNVHIHLHIRYWPSSDPQDEEPYLDTKSAFIYGYVRQALLIYTCASAHVFQRLGQGSIKRKAIVHFDHLFSDWRYMLILAGPYHFSHLVRIMGEDKNTDWEVRYYMHAGGDQWVGWDERFTSDLEYFEKYCSRFENIKVIPEVYGELTWSLEGKISGITRCITPSSTLWPSWPDDVPWRKFERVRSDHAVPLGFVSPRAGST